MAQKEGFGPKRSILFLHVTGEEHGLHGSRYYSENPLFPLKKTVVDDINSFDQMDLEYLIIADDDKLVPTNAINFKKKGNLSL